MARKQLPTYEFGPFRLDPAERKLARDSESIPLPAKELECLLALVENAGFVMSKDELRRLVWADATIDDIGLARCIDSLRQALGDSPEGSQFIETVSGRGYRFVADVREIGGPETPSQPPPVERAAATAGRWFAALVLLGLMAIAYIAYQRVRPSFGGDEKRIQLAVLPIENLTGSAQQDFLSEGLTEEFITLLRRLHPERLVVLGQSSTAKYRGAIRDPTAIGRELGVDYILEGKLGRAGNQLGLSLQLVQTKSNLMVWSEQTLLESPMDLSLAQSMSQAVAENLNLQSVSIFADTAPIHSEAFWELLKGRFYARRALANGKDIAKNHFRRAIEFDPNYAPAYAALAEALAASTALLTDELIQGTAATLKALELAPNLPEAHTAAGLVAMYHLDWASAERSLRRGVELDPNSPHARLQLAVLLRNLGRFEQAMKEIREAQQLDPLSVVVNRELGITQFYAREFSSAVSQLRATLEIDPADPESQIWFAQSCAYQGLFGEADAAIAKLSVVPVQNKDLRLAQIFASRGEKERARAILKSATAPGERPNPFEAAAAHAALFERSIALDWLEKGVQNRHPGRVILRIDPRLDSLRADPRFAQLLREIGLSP